MKNATESKKTKAVQAEMENLRQTHIGRLFLRAHRDFSMRAIQKLRLKGHVALGLSHTALLANLDIEGNKMTILANRMGVTKQAVGKLVRELEEKGYVKMTESLEDKRAMCVVYTEKGWQFLQDAHEVKQQIEAEYMAILGKNNLHLLRTLLEKIIE